MAHCAISADAQAEDLNIEYSPLEAHFRKGTHKGSALGHQED